MHRFSVGEPDVFYAVTSYEPAIPLVDCPVLHAYEVWQIARGMMKELAQMEAVGMHHRCLTPRSVWLADGACPEIGTVAKLFFTDWSFAEARGHPLPDPPGRKEHGLHRPDWDDVVEYAADGDGGGGEGGGFFPPECLARYCDYGAAFPSGDLDGAKVDQYMFARTVQWSSTFSDRCSLQIVYY